MARHETASSKPDATTVANIENIDPPLPAEDQDQYGGGRAGASGGSSAQVFSIEDDPDYVPGVGLVIPAGTDWSASNPHPLGQITGLVEGQAIGFKFWFETLVADADIAAGTPQHVVLLVSEVPNYLDANNYAVFTAHGVSGGIRTMDDAAGVPESLSLGGLAVAMNDVGDPPQARLKAGASGTDLWQQEELVRGHAPPDPAYVGLYTDGPLPTDITVVRARAAFLVI